MKRINITLTLIVAFTIGTLAQEQVKLLKFKGIKADMGLSWDKYKNMDLDWMKSRTSQDGAYTQDISQMKEGSIFYSSLGGMMGGQLLFTAPSLGNDVLIPEVRIGASAIFGKEAVVEYNDTKGNSAGYNSLMYCFVENETRLNTEIVWRVGDQSKVTFYGGIGANLSGSFSNELYVFDNYYNNRTVTGNNFEAFNSSSVDQIFDGKSVFYQRLYVPIGVDLKMFRHLQGTIEYKVGGGMEQVIGGKVSTFRTGEFNFGMRFNIAKNNTPSIFDL